MLGPTLGGWLTDYVSWRAAFYVNLPVGLIAMSAIYYKFPDIRPPGRPGRLDWAGVLTLTGCVVPLLLALTWVTDYGWTSRRVEFLLAFSVVMLAAFLYAETRAAEPLIPLSLFRNPVISVCSIAVFTLGMGMFGVILYLPLYMQGVLGASATRSGNLLTPLMMGMVAGSIVTGQMNLRMATYKPSAVVGSILVAAGMILLARMDGATQMSSVVVAMVIGGFGMGLLNPVYTVAVQNSAPRHHMGAATASTTFFRSIGSTLGVAVFGSLLLTNYHRDFANGVPPGTPQSALQPFSNPMMLPQIRSQLETSFGQASGGLNLLSSLLANVRGALAHGLHLIFLSSAILMTLAVVLHLLLPNVRLQARMHEHEPPAH
jgi:predicted MFS family arabinose efflux permease